MESEERLLEILQLKNRHFFQQKMLEQLSADSEQQFATTADAYEPSSGLMQLSDSSGKTFYGSAITNGAISIGESIRLRGGTIPKYDSMPRVMPTTTAPPIEKDPDIFVGFLIQTVPGTGDRLGQVSYTFNQYYAYLALGYMQSGSLAIKKVNQVPRPIDILQTYSWPDNLSPIFGYYSIGYESRNLIFLYFYPSLSEPQSLEQLSMEIDVLKLDTTRISSKNLNQYSLSSGYRIKLTITSLAFSGGDTANTIQGEQNSGEAIKYKNSKGIIKYVAISGCADTDFAGGLKKTGVLIWDLGDIFQIASTNSSVQNPACHFGFSWTYAKGQGTHIPETVFLYGGYGTEGGIVLNIESLGPNPIKGNIFIPEQYLIGQGGVEIEKSAIITNNIPPPIDTRPTVYKGNLNLDAVASKLELIYTTSKLSDYKLFFYSNTSQDKGKQIFQ